jgi:hypothetical protein
MIIDGSKDVGSSHTSTVDLAKDLVDITPAKRMCPSNDEDNAHLHHLNY